MLWRYLLNPGLLCSANAPRQLPTDHEVETGEAGPSGSLQIPRWESSHTSTMEEVSHSTIANPITVSHDRTRPLTNNSGQCWKLIRDLNWRSTRQSHQIVLQLYQLSQLPILLLLFMTAPGSLQKLQATVLKLMQNFSWRMLIQLRHLPWLGI